MFIHNFERTFSVRVVCLSLHSAAAGTSDTNPEHWAFSLTAWGWSSVELINMSRWNVLFLINDVQALVRTLGNVYKILKVRSRESEKIKSIKTEILSHWPKASAENKPLIVVFVFCYDHHEVTVKCMYVHDLYSCIYRRLLCGLFSFNLFRRPGAFREHDAGVLSRGHGSLHRFWRHPTIDVRGGDKVEGGSWRQVEFIQRQSRGGRVARQQVRSGQRCSH